MVPVISDQLSWSFWNRKRQMPACLLPGPILSSGNECKRLEKLCSGYSLHPGLTSNIPHQPCILKGSILPSDSFPQLKGTTNHKISPYNWIRLWYCFALLCIYTHISFFADSTSDQSSLTTWTRICTPQWLRTLMGSIKSFSKGESLIWEVGFFGGEKKQNTQFGEWMANTHI